MMNRPRQDRPVRDRVWVKPGEKAAAIPEKPQYDDERLLKLLQSVKRELPAILNLHELNRNKLFLNRIRKDSNFKRPPIYATLFQIENCWCRIAPIVPCPPV